MDSEYILVLDSIRSQLNVALYLLAGILLATGAVAFLRIKEDIKKSYTNSEVNRCSELYREGKYEKLIKITSGKLKKDPLNIHMMWFNAKGLYQLGDYAEAERLEPDWSDNIEHHLNEIREHRALHAAADE